MRRDRALALRAQATGKTASWPMRVTIDLSRTVRKSSVFPFPQARPRYSAFEGARSGLRLQAPPYRRGGKLKPDASALCTMKGRARARRSITLQRQGARGAPVITTDRGRGVPSLPTSAMTPPPSIRPSACHAGAARRPKGWAVPLVIMALAPLPPWQAVKESGANGLLRS